MEQPTYLRHIKNHEPIVRENPQERDKEDVDIDAHEKKIMVWSFNIQFSHTDVLIGCFVPRESLLCHDNASAML